MNTKVLMLLLALSVLFNISVLIGFTQTRSQKSDQPASEDQVVKEVAGELKLDEKQAKMFAELRGNLHSRGMVFDEGAALVQQDLLAELRKESPDIDQVRQLVARRAELDQQRRLANAELFGEFIGVLTPQQRKALGMRFGFGGHRPPPLDMLHRFDTNHDGRLDADELKAAKVQFESRRKEMQDMPHPWRRPPEPGGDGWHNDHERGDTMDPRRGHPQPPQPPPPL